eukprot:9072573-Alexandrium_andersonii.AAC.1
MQAGSHANKNANARAGGTTTDARADGTTPGECTLNIQCTSRRSNFRRVHHGESRQNMYVIDRPNAQPSACVRARLRVRRVRAF